MKKLFSPFIFNKKIKVPAAVVAFLGYTYLVATKGSELIATNHIRLFELQNQNRIAEAKRIDNQNGNTKEMSKLKEECNEQLRESIRYDQATNW